MILHSRESALPARREGRPWAELPLQDAVFCSFWSTGPDATVDGIVRLMALKPGSEPGSFERFDRLCNPFPEDSDLWSCEERLEKEFGLDRARLEASLPVAASWAELERFLRGRPIIVPDLADFETWRAHVAGPACETLDAIGLEEIRGLLTPGVQVPSCGVERAEKSLRALEPEEVRANAAEIVASFLGQAPRVIALAVAGYLRAWRGLEPDSAAVRVLRFALALADRPQAWTAGVAFREGGLADGGLARASEAGRAPEDLVADLTPKWTLDASLWQALETVPVTGGAPAPFDAEDMARLDEIFRTFLPASFASPGSFASGAAQGARASYREGQHEVARAVAETLGSDELLLVHAPTGTGKTLAYLVPALMWARRHRIRIGVATYTRALQQQAMDREMPRALAALAQAGEEDAPRVALLKGRENYLCWRALKLAVPDEKDDGEAWLAWTALALFALRDAEGDLDRVSLRPPIPLESVAPWRRRLADLLRQVRGRSACCAHEEDKLTCAAEIARRRAERSHLVVTNQAFALARPEFFKHIIFDECEHLHDQAHGAWSHVLTFRQMRGTLARLHSPEARESHSLLDRMRRAVPDDTPTARAIESGLLEWEAVAGALLRMDASLEGFEAWRETASRERSERESHSLLREYVEQPEAAGLVECRSDLCRGFDRLESALAELAERMYAAPLRGTPSLRRTLEISRTELAGMREAIEAWLPLEGGRPAFRAGWFHDLEIDARGERSLVARVLLPNEVLGRSYYPQLSTAVFISATTWLRGSFEPALGYLGLDRAAEPAPDEDRPPRVVRTFRSPEVFDYSRVLVAVPRDAPSVGGDKDAYLDYVRRFVGHLGERTRGRMLVLFTNAQDAKRVGEELYGFFRARSIPLWFQNMESATKEELSDLFRSRVDSVLLGVDTFWFGADFPGETLEYLVIVRLPYGVPDRYHHAQCAALGTSDHWRRIYMPRALAKFRQGFGRLMRRESDRGCVFVLDGRALEPRHRAFLRELPIGVDAEDSTEGFEPTSARLVRGETDRCLREALAHMGLLAELRRRGLDVAFSAEEAADS